MKLTKSIIQQKLRKSKSKPEIIINTKAIKPDYFFITDVDKKKYILNRIKLLKKGFCELLKDIKFQNIKFQNIDYKSKEPFYTFGYITSLNGDKIDKNDCYILNEVDSEVQMVKLNLDELPAYSLYNGIIIAIKCRNSSSNIYNELILEELHSIPMVNTIVDLKTPVTILASKGSFDVNFFDKLPEDMPEVLILFGPFLEFPYKYEELIEIIDDKVIKRNMYTEVILIPSLEDYNFFGVLPQPGIRCGNTRIHCIKNPSELRINGYVVSVSNFDSLKYLEENEIFYFNEKVSEQKKFYKFDKITRHLYYFLFQMSFLPAIPESIPVNYNKSLTRTNCPDISIMSSDCEFSIEKIFPRKIINISSSSSSNKNTYYKISLDLEESNISKFEINKEKI